MWEDLGVSSRLCFYAKKISFVSEALYHYVQYNSNSLLVSISEKKINEKIKICTQIENFLFTEKVIIEYQVSLARRELMAKEDLVLVKGYRDFNQWNRLWPQAKEYIWKIDMSLYRKLVYSFVSHQCYTSACLCLWIRDFLR